MRTGTGKRERGSAVIEAVVCLTIFIAGIMTILSFINMCRAQAAVAVAVDATAKEMAQYAYFYHLTGLDRLEQENINATQEDRDKMNAIAGGTQAVYKVFETLSDQSDAKDIEALISGTVETMSGDSGAISEVENAAGGITPGNAAEKINTMAEAVKSIEDPMDFLKSVVTIATLEGASYLRSQLIAAPLAQMLAVKHFGETREEADAFLRSLNIDGVDALNFKMSTIFAPATPKDIHLVCYYQMKPVQFFNIEFGEITLCKESVTQAWLGGDRVYTAKDSQQKEASVWEMGSLEYGKYIVNAEKKELREQNCYDAAIKGVHSFDGNNNTWIHIRSMDIYADSYRDNPQAIKNALYSEYQKLWSAAQTSQETIQVNDGGEKISMPSPKESRKLEFRLVIPEGMETAAFQEGWKMFQEAVKEDGNVKVQYTQGYGVSPNSEEGNNRDTPD